MYGFVDFAGGKKCRLKNAPENVAYSRFENETFDPVYFTKNGYDLRETTHGLSILRILLHTARVRFINTARSRAVGFVLFRFAERPKTSFLTPLFSSLSFRKYTRFGLRGLLVCTKQVRRIRIYPDLPSPPRKMYEFTMYAKKPRDLKPFTLRVSVRLRA